MSELIPLFWRYKRILGWVFTIDHYRKGGWSVGVFRAYKEGDGDEAVNDAQD